MNRMDDEVYRLTILNEKKVDVKFDFALNLLSNMDKVLTTAPLKDKINILGSMFPEKIEFDGEKHRTDSVIFKDTSQLYSKKRKSQLKILILPSKYPGRESNPHDIAITGF